MLTAVVQLRGQLQMARLPLELPGADEQRTARQEMVDQVEDYVLPRLMTVDAPLLTVVGGSTGAGKSTLVNSLVGRRVTQPGVLRPTTRSPVLVHHPDDAQWFGQDRLLPDLERVSEPTNDPRALQLVPADTMPAGLAVLDAPDIDSVEEQNRTLAAQLLAAADLWLFVTSAARYADQVPWDYLRRAAERSAAVAIVLDRTPDDAIGTVSTHLARMLASRGLKDSPLFVVTEGPVSDDGLLPAESVADVRGWLDSLAENAEARTHGRAADARGSDPHDDPAYPRGRGRRDRAGHRRGAAARGRRPRLRRRPRQDRGGVRRRHAAAGRGAGPVAGVRRHRRAAARTRAEGRAVPRPARERCAPQAAAGRAGLRRGRVRARDADPRARRGSGRARGGLVGGRTGPARRCSTRSTTTSAARRATSAAGPNAPYATGSRACSRWSAPRAPTSAAPPSSWRTA